MFLIILRSPIVIGLGSCLFAGLVGDQKNGSRYFTSRQGRRRNSQKIAKAIVKRKHHGIRRQPGAAVARVEVVTQRDNSIMTLEEIELGRKAVKIYMQTLRSVRTAGRPFGNAMVAKKDYPLAMEPGRESGHTDDV